MFVVRLELGKETYFSAEENEGWLVKVVRVLHNTFLVFKLECILLKKIKIDLCLQTAQSIYVFSFSSCVWKVCEWKNLLHKVMKNIAGFENSFGSSSSKIQKYTENRQ